MAIAAWSTRVNDMAPALPAPEGEPLVHFSGGVDVRIGRPSELPDG